MESKERTFDAPFLADVAGMVNRHLSVVDSDSPPQKPTVNDEVEILLNLMGLSRLIEYNVRVAIEKFKFLYKVNFGNASRYEELIDLLEPHVTNKEKIRVLHVARQISNGLVHSDFKKVYEKSKEAYEIEGFEFHYSKFDPPVLMFQTTITKHGLNVNVAGDEATATDSKGTPIPLKVLRPDGTNEIDIDFEYFWKTGTFIFTYDVLFSAYKFSVAFKEDMKDARNARDSTNDRGTI